MELALATVTALLIGAVYVHVTESAAWRDERAELLDRVMAKTYSEFVYTATATTVETPQLTTDALEAAWYEANARETEAA